MLMSDASFQGRWLEISSPPPPGPQRAKEGGEKGEEWRGEGRRERREWALFKFFIERMADSWRK